MKQSITILFIFISQITIYAQKNEGKSSSYYRTVEYFDASDIDKDRVVHSPIMNIEELKFDIETLVLDEADKMLNLGFKN